MSSLRSLRENQSGILITEFAIIVPILLLAAIAGLEYSRSFKYIEVAKMLSREAASIAFRMCSGETDEQRADRCLNTVREDLQGFGDNLFEGTGVFISLYRYQGEYGTCTGEIVRVAAAGAQQLESEIEFVDQDQSGSRVRGQIKKSTLCENRVLVVSEVFIPFQSVIWFVPGLSSVVERTGGFYDIAIM